MLSLASTQDSSIQEIADKLNQTEPSLNTVNKMLFQRQKSNF